MPVLTSFEHKITEEQSFFRSTIVNEGEPDTVLEHRFDKDEKTLTIPEVANVTGPIAASSLKAANVTYRKWMREVQNLFGPIYVPRQAVRITWRSESDRIKHLFRVADGKCTDAEWTREGGLIFQPHPEVTMSWTLGEQWSEWLDRMYDEIILAEKEI